MNEEDLYSQLKNAFLLGNYFKVFEFLKTCKMDELNDMLYKDEIASVIVRSGLLLSERKTPEIQATINQNKTLKGFNDILEPFLKILQQGNEAEIKKAIVEVSKITNDVGRCMLNVYYGAFTGNASLTDSSQSMGICCELEMNLVVVLFYLKLNQFTLAEDRKKIMSSSDDDDIATHLAHIYILICVGKIEDAIFLIDETKEKFQDSLKLLNLKAACLIALKQYDNAKVMLDKLLVILTTKEQYRDKQETEICLNNLIVLSLIQGLPYEEYVKQLPPTSAFATKYMSASNLFDSLISQQK